MKVRVLIMSLLLVGLTNAPLWSQKRPAFASAGHGPFAGSGENLHALTPEETQATLEYLRSIDPQAADRLDSLQTGQPKVFVRQIARARQRMMRMQALEKRDPQRYARETEIQKLELASRRLGREIREAAANDSARLVRDLRPILNKLFDLREQERQESVKILEKRLEGLREKLEERQARMKTMEKHLEDMKEKLAERQRTRIEIVERRIEQLHEKQKDLH